MHPAIAQLAADRTSGATALVLQAIAILQSLALDRGALERGARDLCRAQPSMAGLYTAGALSLSASDPASALGALAARVARASATIARLAAPLIALRQHPRALRIVTTSRSAAVETTLLALAASEDVHVSCGESRPAREGIGLAARLSEARIRTDLYTDAGLSTAVPGSDALIVGADALGSGAFINKAGTGALCALAAAEGVPVFVLAGREKILPDVVFAALPLAEGHADEVSVPGGPYAIRNPYFERVSWLPVGHVVTDGGEVQPRQLVTACSWSEFMTHAYMSHIR